MSNFGIRFALPMDVNRSEQLIDSSAADDLDTGEVIAFCSRKTDESERYRKYQVPFQELDDGAAEDSGTMNDIKIQKKLEEESSFKKDKVYYQEDLMQDFDIVKRVQTELGEQIQRTLQTYDFNGYLLLGPSTVYNGKENDMVELFLEKRKNGGIALIGDTIEKLAYLLCLSLYNILKNGKKRTVTFFQADDKVTDTLSEQLNQLLKDSDHRYYGERELKESLDNHRFFEEELEESEDMKPFYERRANRVFVIIGLENMDVTSEEYGYLTTYIKESTKYGAIWLVVSEPTEDYHINDVIMENCTYQFLYVTNEQNFDKYRFEYTERSIDATRIELKIQHRYQQQGFKMLNLPELEEYIEPSIDIPDYLFH